MHYNSSHLLPATIPSAGNPETSSRQLLNDHHLRPLSRTFASLVMLLIFTASLQADTPRPMTLEDIMNFHHIHMQSVQVNGDGSWVAYSAGPDRGDGYGEVISSNGQVAYRIDRAERPQFAANGHHAMFTLRPPLAEVEAASRDNRPDNDAVLVDLSNGAQTVFEHIRQWRFSESGNFLFIHHTYVEDTLLTDEQNKKLKEAGTDLRILETESLTELVLPFVDSWTPDSLATTLVFTLKDTLEAVNGLYYFPLNELTAEPRPLDTLDTAKFSHFTWHGQSSRLAYMRALDLEKDTIETATLKVWQPGNASPETLLSQDDVPEGYFLPYDNRLEWTRNGERLYFGFRPGRFAAKPEEKKSYASVLDSLRQDAAVDIWHGDDPLIKTHEKESWNRISRQNLLSVYHLPDRRFVQLATTEVPNLQTASTGDHALATSSLPYEVRITWEGWFRDVYVMNLLTGENQLVVEELQDLGTLSPDGHHVLYFHDKHWHAFDTSTGEHRNLTEQLDTPFYRETHDTPSETPSYRMAGWLDDGYSALIYDRYDVWLADLSNGEMRNVTGGWGRDNQTVLRIRKLDDEPWFGRRDEVLLEGFNDNTKVRAIYSARLHREGVSLLRDAGQNIRLRRLSKDGNTLLYTLESQDVFPDLWVTNTRFRNPVQLTQLQEQLESFNWGQAELISYHSADGVPLQGIVIKPGDYDPSKKYPVFLYYYEKFSQRLHDFNQTVINHRPGFGFYASNGYVVFLPDIHFVEGRPGMSAVKSLVPAVQKIIDMGIADPDAIGLHGHSWSGYQTAYVVTQTDIFKAAITGAPVSNMTSAYGGIRWGSGLARQFQYETGQSRLGSSIFESRYLYIENSPLFYANEINTPMLIMHGDADEAVPWEQSIELYLAMRRAGKEVVFLQYRDEPHHLQKYPNKIDYTIRMKEYFDYHLKGMEPADWIIKGVSYEGK
jgi:dipeptidyl aminopeptidase/acylaminoacyl peptidase